MENENLKIKNIEKSINTDNICAAFYSVISGIFVLFTIYNFNKDDSIEENIFAFFTAGYAGYSIKKTIEYLLRKNRHEKELDEIKSK